MNISSLIKKYNEFILVGCCTDICVMQLALSLKTYLNKIESEQKIIVFQNATATFDTPEHEASTYHEFALNIMKQAGVKIKTWDK
ncbi:cysteine hydrolase [Mycoplasma nasistruthionis]|uniref:Cysteine hydrolase n=1 Tax=Mycoplasma nasistruthionis TaxID=353852 RepID=A0A4Y6I5V6_9MOLU|nr:cysteine hydrolase [Mycoplasma nasistruthionis]